ncbi:MAG: septum formation initiator family protein [Candidatus Cloacimonetes bacterium]|nr:septum formation initiator family protein [Candidatus Cloacimonadota bacterium]
MENPIDELQPINLPNEQKEVKVENFKSNSNLSYTLFFIGFFAIFMYVSQVYMTKYYQIEAKKSDILKLREKVEELSLENDRLSNIIEELKTPEGLEKLARKKLNLIRPGEKLIRWKK